MNYIKGISDVMGLDNRIKLILSTSDGSSDVTTSINNLKLNTADGVYTLYRKPSANNGTIFYCVLKTGEHEITEGEINSGTVVESDELLCKVTVSGMEPEYNAINVFDETEKWGSRGDIRLTIEAGNAESVLTATFKAENATNIHYQAFRGVRSINGDLSISETNTVTFPV